ncbi:hypothetical protein [Pseudoxanthomonas mexicana]
MTEYRLRGMHIGPQNEVPISAKRHAEHARARQCLVDAGDFERRYELLKGNFLAFEDFCAQWDMRSTVNSDYGYELWAGVILEADRHIMNLLSTGRTYADQVVRDFKFFGDEGHFATKATELLNAAHARSFDYRFTYELRNRAQHRALPVDGIDPAIRPKREHHQMALFYTSKQRIIEDRGTFKLSVLDEAPDKVDLRAVLRGYMAEMSGIHIALRAIVDAECAHSREVIERAKNDYADAQEDDDTSGNRAIGLASVAINDDDIIEATPLLLDWDDARVKLAAKNRFPIKLKSGDAA